MNQPLPGLEETQRRLTDHDVVAVVLELPIGEATPVAAIAARKSAVFSRASSWSTE